MNESTPLQPPHSLMLDRAPAWIKGRPWLERLLVAITGVSISTKIMGIVLALTILLGLAVTLQVRNLMSKALQGELHNQGYALAADLADRAAPLVLTGDVDALNNLLRDTARNHLDIRYILLLDPERQVLASAIRESGNVASGTELSAEIMAADLALPTPESTHLDYTSADEHIHEFAIPIQGGEFGLVRLGLIESRVVEIVGEVTAQMWLTTLLVAGVGILAALLLTWLLTRPILDLVATTERLRQGDLSVRAPYWNEDEIGALSEAFNQMVSELEISQQTVVEKENARTQLLSRLISAQEEERKRIARELHDGVGQALTSILVHIKVLAQSQDLDTKSRMSELRRLVDETLIDVRMLSRELRPSALDDLGLEAALERYMTEFRVRYPQLETDLHCTLPRRLPPNIETSLYRIIQEAMTNTARHGRATSLSVVVNERSSAVQAIVEDNGEGFDVESTRRAGSSVGLHSMTERSELLSGTLEIESSDEGTTVYIEIPLIQSETGQNDTGPNGIVQSEIAENPL